MRRGSDVIWVLLFLAGNRVGAFAPRSMYQPRAAFATPSKAFLEIRMASSDASTTTPTESEKEAASGESSQVKRYFENFPWKRNQHSYNINYRVEGPVNGPPILLIHGFGANINHFRYQFPALVQEGYRVYAIDLLGFGGSDKPKDEHYCIELWVELLLDFLQTMHKDKQWVVAGNSIGGLCSLCVAEQLPKLVRGVVLFNCSGGMTGFRYEDSPLYLRPLLWFVQKVVLGPSLGGRFFENFKTRENVESILNKQGVYGDTTNVNDELMDLLLGPSEDDGAQEVFLKVMAGPPGPKPEAVLPNVLCPVLALWGDADPWTPLDGGAHPGNSFGNYTDDFELQVLPGAGHCPHDECPGQIHAHMLPWMKRLPL